MSETTRPRSLAAVGIVVQDLDRSLDFYTSILGMREAQRIDVEHLQLHEVVLTFPGSRTAAVILMQYADTTDRSFRDDGGKLVVQVGDAVAITEAARAAGHTVTREPSEYAGFGMIAMIADPDGRTIELMGVTGTA